MSIRFLDLQRPKCMHFVQKYLRMKHAIVFKLSHDVLQVRPLPYSLLEHAANAIVCRGSISTSTRRLSCLRKTSPVVHVDKNYVPMRLTMARVLLQPPSDLEQAKMTQRLLDKFRYCKEVLLSLCSARANARSQHSAASSFLIDRGVRRSIEHDDRGLRRTQKMRWRAAQMEHDDVGGRCGALLDAFAGLGCISRWMQLYFKHYL